MNEEYLWDRSGPPDAFVEELERTLAPLRLGAPKRRFPVLRMAAAAAVLSAVALWQIPRPATSWHEGATALAPGEVLRTGSNAIHLEASNVGEVDLGPDSQLRVETGRKLSLDRGTLRAFIWAPARQFVVDTPSAQAVDLGCAYTLQVGPHGDGLLRVEFGWVAFQVGGKESFIPEGAACVTRPKRGPGIPFYEDAPLRPALSQWEEGKPGALAEILREARPRDGLTLWHLLTRVSNEDRERVWQRFRELVPVDVETSAVLRADPRAIDKCWNALNLENTGWWRGWERAWQ